MVNRYCNLTLLSIDRDELLKHLSELGCRSYISPMFNDKIVMYDISLEFSPATHNRTEKDLNFLSSYLLGWTESKYRAAYKEHLESLRKSALSSLGEVFDVSTLGDKASDIIKRYKGISEGILAAWAAHLSEYFSCTVLACFSRDDSKFWYHLASNGNMLDEYSTYTDDKWQPGQPILSENSNKIKGGNAKILSMAFNCPSKVDELESILQKPTIYSSAPPSCNLNYKSMLKESGFADSSLRHWTLAKALNIHPWWVVQMSYDSIQSEEWLDFFGCYDTEAPTTNEALSQLSQTKLQSENQNKVNTEEVNGKLASDYIDAKMKVKGIETWTPENIMDDFDSLLSKLAALNDLAGLKLISIFTEIKVAIMGRVPLSKSGKFYVLQDLIILGELLINKDDDYMQKVAISAFFDLNEMLYSHFMTSDGQLWRKYKPELERILFP
jgi:hypothetical protein